MATLKTQVGKINQMQCKYCWDYYHVLSLWDNRCVVVSCEQNQYVRLAFARISKYLRSLRRIDSLIWGWVKWVSVLQPQIVLRTLHRSVFVYTTPSEVHTTPHTLTTLFPAERTTSRKLQASGLSGSCRTIPTLTDRLLRRNHLSMFS